MHTATAIAPETSVIAARRQAAAVRLGVDVDRVRVVHQEPRTMREAGITIDVDAARHANVPTWPPWSFGRLGPLGLVVNRTITSIPLSQAPVCAVTRPKVLSASSPVRTVAPIDLLP